MTRHCASHPRRQAVAECVSCGRAICTDCLVNTRVGLKCAACAGGRQIRARSRPAVPLAAVALLIVLAGGAVAAVAALALAAQPGARAHPVVIRTGERRLFVNSADGTSLAAMLRLPSVPGAGMHPAVLILPEPWAADRDGRQLEIGQTNSPYRVLADQLAGVGIVSLRFDQRGIGETQLGPGGTLGGLSELQQDAVAAYFTLATQPEVDRKRIAVVGHGAAGLVAMSLFGRDGAPAALAVVDTPARSFADEIRDHLRDHILPAFAPRGEELLAQYDGAVAQIKATGKAPRVDPSLAAFFPAAHIQLLDDLYHANPAALAAAVEAPVLVFNGRLDTEITVVDAQLLASTFVKAPHELLIGQSTGHNLEVLPDIAADPGHAAQMARSSPRDTDLAAIAGIAGWLQARLIQAR